MWLETWGNIETLHLYSLIHLSCSGLKYLVLLPQTGLGKCPVGYIQWCQSPLQMLKHTSPQSPGLLYKGNWTCLTFLMMFRFFGFLSSGWLIGETQSFNLCGVLNALRVTQGNFPAVFVATKTGILSQRDLLLLKQIQRRPGGPLPPWYNCWPPLPCTWGEHIIVMSTVMLLSYV